MDELNKKEINEKLDKVTGGEVGAKTEGNYIIKLVEEVKARYANWLYRNPDASRIKRRKQIAWYMDITYCGYDPEGIEIVENFRTNYPNDWEAYIDEILETVHG